MYETRILTHLLTTNIPEGRLHPAFLDTRDYNVNFYIIKKKKHLIFKRKMIIVLS